MTIATLQDLLINDMTDMYSAERQLLLSLPIMAGMASSPALQHSLQTHLAQTDQQVERLKVAFELLNAPAVFKACAGMAGLIQEGKELAEKDITPAALDAALIAASQRVEHYEIAAYGTMSEYARALGLHEVRFLLEESLAEEKATNLILNGLAEGGINQMTNHGVRIPAEGGINPMVEPRVRSY